MFTKEAWPDFARFDSGLWGLDYEKSAHDEDFGKKVAEYLQSLLLKQGLSIASDAKYLGLGAGMAYPELAFAQTFGIKPADITLLDTHFGWAALRRIETVSPETTILDGRGLWKFLDNPEVTGFSLISIFGMDHKLRTETIPHIAQNLPKILVPNGVVCIAPAGAYIEGLWAGDNFTVLCEGGIQAYSLNPKEYPK